MHSPKSIRREVSRQGARGEGVARGRAPLGWPATPPRMRGSFDPRQPSHYTLASRRVSRVTIPKQLQIKYLHIKSSQRAAFVLEHSTTLQPTTLQPTHSPITR